MVLDSCSVQGIENFKNPSLQNSNSIAPTDNSEINVKNDQTYQEILNFKN